MKIQLYTTDKEPEDITPFAMVPQAVWRKYELGELNGQEVLLYAVLHCHINPYQGIGVASYEKICGWLQLKPSYQNINRINKVMVELRDKHRLVWYPAHSGSRGFEYVVAKFKLGKLQENKGIQPDRWVDIDHYFPVVAQSSSRGSEVAKPQPSQEPQPKQPPQEQRSERSKDGSMTSLGSNLDERYGRPPYTDTNTET